MSASADEVRLGTLRNGLSALGSGVEDGSHHAFMYIEKEENLSARVQYECDQVGSVYICTIVTFFLQKMRSIYIARAISRLVYIQDRKNI